MHSFISGIFILIFQNIDNIWLYFTFGYRSNKAVCNELYIDPKLLDIIKLLQDF